MVNCGGNENDKNMNNDYNVDNFGAGVEDIENLNYKK